MAIYHLCIKAVSRTTNRSAVAAAAYRACVELTDERTGRIFDYRPRARAGSLAEPAYIVAPSDITGDIVWARDRSVLWNRAEIEAKRKDAKTAREVEIAIPTELDEPAASEFGRAMGTYLANRFRVAVDVARHAPSRDGDNRNRHLHMLMTTREITADGFGARTAELDNRFSGAIDEIRAQCAILTNAALEKAGSPVRVDHRSYANQGIDRLPGIHLGDAIGMERRLPGIRTRIGDRHREIMAINAEMEAHSVARRELAVAGQAQRAALMAAMRDDLGLTRSAGNERSRPSKLIQKTAADIPEVELVSAAPETLHPALKKSRHEASRKRRSRLPILEPEPILPPLVQAAVTSAIGQIELARPTQAQSLHRQTTEPVKRPRPIVAGTKIASPGAVQLDLAATGNSVASGSPIEAPAIKAPEKCFDTSVGHRAPAAAADAPNTVQQSPAALWSTSNDRETDPIVAKLCRTHPAAERLAAEFQRAKMDMNDAHRHRVDKIARTHLGDRLWTSLCTALANWANSDLLALSNWVKRIPVLSDATLKYMSKANAPLTVGRRVAAKSKDKDIDMEL